jgi:hypothetical protein
MLDDGWPQPQIRVCFVSYPRHVNHLVYNPIYELLSFVSPTHQGLGVIGIR